jgi:predicted RNase H-like HicB family nuclease
MDACYYSLVRRTRDGQFVGWVPDLHGVTAWGRAEDDVLRELARNAKELLRKMMAKGLPLPEPSPPHELPLGDRDGRYRRLLLVLTGPMT